MISSYNSTPVKSSPGKNQITINVQAYRPKQGLQPVSSGYQPVTKERKSHKKRVDNKTQYVAAGPEEPLGESRNKPRRGYVNLTTCGGTTLSQQSSGSKKQSAS